VAGNSFNAFSYFFKRLLLVAEFTALVRSFREAYHLTISTDLDRFPRFPLTPIFRAL